MKVVVLGGTGLISQSIVRDMVEAQHEVFVYNRGRTPARLPPVAGHIVAERSSVAEYRQLFQDLGVDCVIDMVGYSKTEAEALVSACAGVVPQVIYCSTTDVYVKGRGPYPLTEKSVRGAQRSYVYAWGKVESEEVLEQAYQRGEFALTIIRPAQTYGGPRHGPVHPLGHHGYQLLRASRGQKLILHGDGSSLWCATFAPDVAAAFVAAAGNARAFGRDYIVAGREVVTWRRYWEIICAAFGFPELDCVTMPTELLRRAFGREADLLAENFQYNNVFDCARAEVELGFRYSVCLADGFARVAREFGELWLKEGEQDEGLSFARDYERCLRLWPWVVEQLAQR
jgi:nucleoside-diphosphate-sugar epimerase